MKKIKPQLSFTEQLIDLCATPVSLADRQRAAQHLLDWLGCAVAGARTDPGNAIRRYAGTAQYASGGCFVVGASSLSASGAAFVNGGLGNILELDDVHRASILHVGDVVIPAALAVAQHKRASGRELLDAIVRGYEIAIRIGTLASSGGYSHWYNSGTCGVFGAAFAAGSLLTLDKKSLCDCLGQAGMMASGLWRCRFETTLSKQLATANAASNAVKAAMLCSDGFPGARYILEGEAGFLPTYYPAVRLTDLDLNPVESWRIHDVSFKPWPACRHTHPAIEAALLVVADEAINLNEQMDKTAEVIERIEVQTYQSAIDFCDNESPQSAHEARFSLQHCVAVALARGAPGIIDFETQARVDGRLIALREKVSLSVDKNHQNAFPAHMGSTVIVNTASGARVCVLVENAKGDPENPLTQAELCGKFKTLATYAGMSPDHASQLQNAVENLPASSDLVELDRALAVVSPA